MRYDNLKLMEELLTLKTYIETGKYSDALLLINELEEMSLMDIFNKIDSFSVILLLHLIKQQAEKKTTRSWEASIKESLYRIKKINKRHKAKAFFADKDTLKDILTEAFPIALLRASLETFEGKHSADELEKIVNKDQIIEKALTLIIDEQ